MSKNFMDYDNATSLFTKLKTVLGKKAELKDTMTRADYEDAQNLTAGVYPIEGDADLTVISADMVEYGNGTVKDALDQGTGGSTVTWQQLQVTGDKIAEITVSGVKQDVFSHSIVVSRMQMSGTHIADITIDGVKNEIFAPNGGTGGGHEIVNASGTSLPQEDKLQFTGGLKATDDSTNGKTIIDDTADEYTWAQWNAMTEQQREAIPKAIITNAPSSDITTAANKCMLDDGVTDVQDVTDSIAPTDTTPATAAHAIGDQFYFNGQLVTATAVIAIGDAIAVGTNCTASDTVTEQIHEEHYNVTGTMKSLLSYTSSSDPYKFPNDGYCTVNATAANSQCRLRLVDALGNNISSVKCVYSGADDRTAVFVRKGMQAYVDQQSGTVSINYVPLTSYAE